MNIFFPLKKQKKRKKKTDLFFSTALYTIQLRAKVADRFATLSLKREIIAGESEDEDDA